MSANPLTDRYRIEIRDGSGNLVAILKDAIGITLEQSINTPEILTFILPADDVNLVNIKRSNELWVRDMRSDAVIVRTRMVRQDDARS